MRAMAIIAGGVFRDSIRDRIGYGLVFFSIMLMASSFLLAQLTAGQDVKIIKDIGLSAASGIGLFIAVFFGIGLVTKEVERRSIYSLISKPVTRTQFVIGKYFGLVFTLLVNLTVMAIAFYAVLWYLDSTTADGAKLAWDTPALDPRMLKAFVLIGVELMLITATAIFFSTFSSPFLSVAMTFAVYVIGHFGEDLKNIHTIIQSLVLPYIAKGVYYVMPNLSILDVKSAVVHGLPVSVEHMLLAAGSSLLYVATLLVGAVLIFSRRDLK